MRILYPILLTLAPAAPSAAAEALAEKPSDVAITVYRSPFRVSGSIDLDSLAGFALVSEVRTVHLPAGVSRLRFEGVADGIEPASAIVTGLTPGIIMEKNREGRLLSPSALIAATRGRPVTLLRTDKKTGTARFAGSIRSDAEGGVVFETSEGIEALRCSGLPESFSFEGITDLAASPTLSALVRTDSPMTSTVALSYLARGFDWAADYTATLAADGNTMDLGAWVTLANGNGTAFASARAEVVAGRVNRESSEVYPIDAGGPIVAQCWPRGSTSDPPQYIQIATMALQGMAEDRTFKLAAPAASLQGVSLTGAKRVEQEQLGDLKLYRVPDRTDVAGRQSKQVRLLDRAAIPVRLVYSADLAANAADSAGPASLVLRTRNDSSNHLGVPLPSGRVAVFAMRSGEKLLQHESGLRDLAVGEDVEIDLGDSPDVQVAAVKEAGGGADINRVYISNAKAAAIEFELRLRLPAGGRVVPDQPMAMKDGRPIFRLTIPANESVTLRYQTHAAAG